MDAGIKELISLDTAYTFMNNTLNINWCTSHTTSTSVCNTYFHTLIQFGLSVSGGGGSHLQAQHAAFA